MCREQRYYIFIARSQISFLQEFSSAIKFSPYFTSVTSVDSLDWKDYGAEDIVNRVVNSDKLKNGAIVLMHNGAKYTADALETVIKGLQDKGYELVPISELIYRDGYHMLGDGTQVSDK